LPCGTSIRYTPGKLNDDTVPQAVNKARHGTSATSRKADFTHVGKVEAIVRLVNMRGYK